MGRSWGGVDERLRPTMFIRKDDVVMVISGNAKGTRGKVLAIDRKNSKVTIEGVNRVYKHVKPNRRNPQGGRLSMEMPIEICKVMMIDPEQNVATRVGVRYLPDGSKELYAKKSGRAIRMLSRPDEKYATKKA